MLNTPTDTINPTQPIHPQESCEDSTLIIGELILTTSHGKLESGYYKINKEMYNNTDKIIVAVEFTLE